MKKKKDVKFNILLCANIASLIIGYFVLAFNDVSWWYIVLGVQCAFTFSSVFIYYFIELVNAVKKIANQKEASNTLLPEPEKKENE